MMARRRCPSAHPGSAKVPRSSGPRCASASVMRSMTPGGAGRAASAKTNPQMPHMGSDHTTSTKRNPHPGGEGAGGGWHSFNSRRTRARGGRVFPSVVRLSRRPGVLPGARGLVTRPAGSDNEPAFLRNRLRQHSGLIGGFAHLPYRKAPAASPIFDATECQTCSSSCLSDLPPSVFHAVSPLALPPCMTAAAADGLENSASLVKIKKPSFSVSIAIGDELFALGHDIGIVLRRWALLQDGSGTTEK